MTDSHPDDLARRLLDADPDPTAPATSGATLEDILRREERHDARVRRVALVAAATTLAAIFAATLAVFIVRNADGLLVELSRALLMASGLVGVASFLAASLAALAWLLRSRTPTLKAIEQRLAALERSFLAQRA